MIQMTQAPSRLTIDAKTMRSRMTLLGISPIISQEDKRMKFISEEDFQRLREWKKGKKKQGDSPRYSPKKKRGKVEKLPVSAVAEISGNSQEIEGKKDERIIHLEAKVAELEHQIAGQQLLIDRLNRRTNTVIGGLDVVKTQVETHGALIVNLHYSLPNHVPGSTDPRLRAMKIAQEQQAQQDLQNLDEDGRETVERLEAQDQETSAFFDALDKKRAG